MNVDGGDFPMRHGDAELIKARHDVSCGLATRIRRALMTIYADAPIMVQV